MIELDIRRIRHNLLATLSRRPEAYHRKVLAGQGDQGGQVASIHERIVFKQPDLDKRLQYDDHPRKSLLDMFFDNDATLEAVALHQLDNLDAKVHSFDQLIRDDPNVESGWTSFHHGLGRKLFKGEPDQPPRSNR